MKTKVKFQFQKLPRDYGSLIALLPPRPIHDRADYDNVAEVTDAMALWEDEFSPDQADYFEALCSFLEKYDAEHVKWPHVNGREMLQHLVEQHNLSAADVSRILGGSRNLGAMILRGERNLTLNHIRILARHFNVPAGLFV
ncbi:MAG TPA: transcriptional regulator [Verrucomicrobiae bacterium]|nr:transcriptional regulator [Verrucomicrobiae bacterium]